MYETFYNLTEKPFTLLPDPGFLYLSDKHQMALTLLEYGLHDHAGFTVISGEIGAGKTTLIRHLLNNMEQEYTVGLITNTHESFGELLQWVLHAFGLEHKGMSRVEMHQRFIDFIIDEYAHNRRTVLIVVGAFAHARLESARARDGLVPPESLGWTVEGKPARVQA